MRVNVNLPKELVDKIDAKSDALYISRSAYICTALVAKLQADEMMSALPELQKMISEMQMKSNSEA